MSVALLGGDNEASCGREWPACGGWGQGSPNIQHGVLAPRRVGAGTDGGGPSAQRPHTGFSVGNWRHARSLPADAPHGAPHGCQSRRVRVGERRGPACYEPALCRHLAEGRAHGRSPLGPHQAAASGERNRDRGLPASVVAETDAFLGHVLQLAAGPAVLGVLGEEQLSWKWPHPLGPQCEVSWHLSPVSRVAHGGWLCMGKLGS